jgi:hypothetical protein
MPNLDRTRNGHPKVNDLVGSADSNSSSQVTHHLHGARPQCSSRPQVASIRRHRPCWISRCAARPGLVARFQLTPGQAGDNQWTNPSPWGPFVRASACHFNASCSLSAGETTPATIVPLSRSFASFLNRYLLYVTNDTYFVEIAPPQEIDRNQDRACPNVCQIVPYRLRLPMYIITAACPVD